MAIASNRLDQYASSHDSLILTITVIAPVINQAVENALTLDRNFILRLAFKDTY